MNEKWQSDELLQNNKSLAKACEEIFFKYDQNENF